MIIVRNICVSISMYGTARGRSVLTENRVCVYQAKRKEEKKTRRKKKISRQTVKRVLNLDDPVRCRVDWLLYQWKVYAKKGRKKKKGQKAKGRGKKKRIVVVVVVKAKEKGRESEENVSCIYSFYI